jgi:hypothetical protein
MVSNFSLFHGRCLYSPIGKSLVAIAKHKDRAYSGSIVLIDGVLFKKKKKKLPNHGQLFSILLLLFNHFKTTFYKSS